MIDEGNIIEMKDIGESRRRKEGEAMINLDEWMAVSSELTITS